MTTEQGSVILAQFEGRLFHGKTIDKYGGDTCNAIPPMQYHTSYDWLMPVWVKFRDMSVPPAFGIDHYMKCRRLKDIIMTSLISDAFTALVEAVEWGNSVKEKEGM